MVDMLFAQTIDMPAMFELLLARSGGRGDHQILSAVPRIEHEYCRDGIVVNQPPLLLMQVPQRH